MATAVVLEDSAEQAKLVATLVETEGDDVSALLTLWKEGGIFLWERPDQTKVAVVLAEQKDAEDKQAATLLETGKPLLAADGKPLRLLASDLTAAETDSTLRETMKAMSGE